jgi:hypothetical protein
METAASRRAEENLLMESKNCKCLVWSIIHIELEMSKLPYELSNQSIRIKHEPVVKPPLTEKSKYLLRIF